MEEDRDEEPHRTAEKGLQRDEQSKRGLTGISVFASVKPDKTLDERGKQRIYALTEKVASPRKQAHEIAGRVVRPPTFPLSASHRG